MFDRELAGLVARHTKQCGSTILSSTYPVTSANATSVGLVFIAIMGAVLLSTSSDHATVP